MGERRIGLNYLQTNQLGPDTEGKGKENGEISSTLSFLEQQQGNAIASTVNYAVKMLF